MIRTFLQSALIATMLLGFSGVARAQYTVVSGTVTDPQGFHYANGTITAQLNPASSGPWKLSGQPYGGMLPVTVLDANGSFSARIGDNAQITPGSSQWQFTVCGFALTPPIGTGNHCFTVLATVTGATQSLTSALSAAAPALTNISSGGGSPGAPDTSVQTNQGGVFTGFSTFTYSAGLLTVTGVGSGNPFGAGPTIARFGSTDNNGTPLLVTNALSPTVYLSSFIQNIGSGNRGYSPYFFDGSTATTLEIGAESAPFPGNNMNITTTDPTAYVTVEGYVGLAPFTDNNITLGFAARRWSSLNVAGVATVGSVITATHTPSSSSDTGTTGQFAWDSSFFYECVATNTWKRVAIATW